MPNIVDILIDDMLRECDIAIEKYNTCFETETNNNRLIYKGKIEAYYDIRKSLLKRKSQLG
jgi:hypothetical protein